ncbi:MAG: HEXXH motif-containing putative peptide modification protein [Nitrospiraceae bacterium]
MSLDPFRIAHLVRLNHSFRRSIKSLLRGLCDDLERQYPGAVARFDLPLAYFRLLHDSLSPDAWDSWKVVGWVEGLNDLLYFIDVLSQLGREPDRSEFAEQFLAECQERFYEHTYLDELFPNRRPEPSRLVPRLTRLCERLSRELVQESLFLVPGLPCRWVRQEQRKRWIVLGDLDVDLERAEPAKTLPVGIDGTVVAMPSTTTMRPGGKRSSAQFEIFSGEMTLKIGRKRSVILVCEDVPRWFWTYHPPCYVQEADVRWRHGLTLGPTLVYDRQRIPRDARSSSPTLLPRLRRAIDVIEEAWPEGLNLLSLFTTRVVPLRASGVVSFSYRHRPGLSFINMFERDQLDLIDDLIHENSHHHLNLLLRKYVFYKGDHNQERFYSPWRRSLRPIRGILHATFTFTMGALLFERLSTWGQKRPDRWRTAGLTRRDLLRAQFRCLEEVESVRYSIQDLEYANRSLGWLTRSGKELVEQLKNRIAKVERTIAPMRMTVLRSRFSPALRRHVEELRKARQTYGPMRVSRA